MEPNDTALLAVIAKKLRELRADFARLAKQPGPPGDVGAEGKRGEPGAPGKDGAPSKDGKRGEPGAPGKDGKRGEPGAPGKDGESGKDGSNGPMPKHQWQGTKLRFQQTEKRWGEWVELRGPVAVVGGGFSQPSAFNPSGVPSTDVVEPLDEMVIVRDGVFMRVRIALQSGVAPANAVMVNGEAVTVNGQFVVST